ncbi:MAG: MFS transporter [Pseudomonadota bacterium]
MEKVLAMHRSLQLNINLIYAINFCYSFALITPVFVPMVQEHGLNMAQILQTQALYALTIACFEVPSGYLADLWGRQRAIAAGAAFHALACVWLLFADSFSDFLFFEFLAGLGLSMLSGADLALLYDSETARASHNHGQSDASRSLSRLIAVEAAASGFAGLGAAFVLGIGDMRLLIAAQAAIGLVPMILSPLLIESPRGINDQGHGSNARAIVNLLIRGKPILLWITFAIGAFGLLALYAFWIYQHFWQSQGIAVSHFGYIWAAFALTVSVAARYAGLLESRYGWRVLLLCTAVLPIVGLLGMALIGGSIGVMFGFAIQASRGMSLTLFYDALNRRIPGEFRATVNSLVSLAVRSAFIASGPVLGWSLDKYGSANTMLVLAAVFAPLFAMILWGLSAQLRVEHATRAASAAPVDGWDEKAEDDHAGEIDACLGQKDCVPVGSS